MLSPTSAYIYRITIYLEIIMILIKRTAGSRHADPSKPELMLRALADGWEQKSQLLASQPEVGTHLLPLHRFVVDERALRAGIVFDVAVEARVPPSLPVRGFIVVDAGSGVQETEKDMARGLDHDAGMPMPHDEVAGLGLLHALESFHPGVEVVGIRIVVRKSGALVDRVHEMGTVVLGRVGCSGIQRSGDHRKTVIVA